MREAAVADPRLLRRLRTVWREVAGAASGFLPKVVQNKTAGRGPAGIVAE